MADHQIKFVSIKMSSDDDEKVIKEGDEFDIKLFEEVFKKRVYVSNGLINNISKDYESKLKFKIIRKEGFYKEIVNEYDPLSNKLVASNNIINVFRLIDKTKTTTLWDRKSSCVASATQFFEMAKRRKADFSGILNVRGSMIVEDILSQSRFIVYNTVTSTSSTRSIEVASSLPTKENIIKQNNECNDDNIIIQEDGCQELSKFTETTNTVSSKENMKNINLFLRKYDYHALNIKSTKINHSLGIKLNMMYYKIK